jgi:hypothetical protein
VLFATRTRPFGCVVHRPTWGRPNRWSNRREKPAAARPGVSPDEPTVTDASERIARVMNSSVVRRRLRSSG